MGPSQTAQFAAAHRAYHLMQAQPVILEDTAASWLLDPPLSVVLKVGILRKLFWERLLTRIRPISAFIVIRSRYTEDCLEEAIAAGCRQYVVLGAGLDSWALRNELPDGKVFELDQAATQEWKANRVRERLGNLPAQLVLLPIDFERQAIHEVLADSQYDREAQAFVSWLGTLYYLTRPAIEATFASLAQVCAPGSQIVLDYFLPKSGMSPADLRLFEELDRGGTERGEPLQTLLDPPAMAGILKAAGFRVIEDLPAAEIRQRYLVGRSDGLDIPGYVRLCRAERQSGS